jgi:hypothetical protein
MRRTWRLGARRRAASWRREAPCLPRRTRCGPRRQQRAAPASPVATAARLALPSHMHALGQVLPCATVCVCVAAPVRAPQAPPGLPAPRDSYNAYGLSCVPRLPAQPHVRRVLTWRRHSSTRPCPPLRAPSPAKLARPRRPARSAAPPPASSLRAALPRAPGRRRHRPSTSRRWVGPPWRTWGKDEDAGRRVGCAPRAMRRQCPRPMTRARRRASIWAPCLLRLQAAHTCPQAWASRPAPAPAS